MGLGFMYDYMPGGKPDKELMDSIISDRPAMIGAYSGQTICANSLAMEMLLERNRAAFERLVPEVDERTGRYTGFLLHAHSFSLLDYFTIEELGSEAEEAIFESIAAVLDEALSVGVTTMQDAQLYRPFIPMLLEFRRRGGMDRVRLRGTFYVSPYALEDEASLREDLEWWMDTGRSESDPHLVLGDAVKLYIDGVSTSHTAFMLEPYSDTEDDHGDAAWSAGDFKRVMEIVDGMGLQACTHSCGDAGTRRVVDGYVHALEVNGDREARHRVEHCELPLPAERERMARAGIYASMQPTHFYGDETTEKVLGPERLQRYMPWRSLEKSGVELSFGSDWCAGPINPVYGLLIAATRFNFRGNTDWGPGEKVGLEDGVRHWTIDSARALRLEKDIGSLEVGKYGDMVLFSTSPFKLDSFWFLLTHELDLGAMDDFVDLTVVGGKVVYRKQQ
jgi:predicted amidohydrolase YtcJ